MQQPVNETRTEDNRGQGGSQPVFNMPPVVVALIVLCAAVYIVQFYLLSDPQYIWFLLNFAFIPQRFSAWGGFTDITAWFTAISYSFMHGGFAHLAVNSVWFAAFGSPLAGRIGTRKFLLFWILTSILAAFTHYALYPDSNIPLVGASGAISGMMGAAARFGFRRVTYYTGTGRQVPAFGGPLLSVAETLQNRTVLTFVGFWLLINVITGLYATPAGELSGIAWEAHIGGFVAGFFGIALLLRGRS
ncbi:rhomboid family intramembrane serine protease [Pseudochrobactrum sp. AO18b]|uniref:rhomboid family intramembrane serine protease n=1 Tax=Pseudochrobactrum sp. AO18b TaxID=1201036 RepID=UPI0003A25651|nr:rhomboid family intramembrane serine protease [Pseudochrobactrum sp. AO18b]